MPFLFKKKTKGFSLIALTLTSVLILISFGLGFYFGKTQCEICPPAEVDFSLFWEVWYKIEEAYPDKKRLNTQEMIYGAISGMIKSLQDPYTVFLKPEDAKRFIEDAKGTFEGVGMEIGIREGQIQVIAPLEGTPAQKAGLRPGDKILKVDDVFTIDLTLEEVVNLIRGPKGTEVQLTIYREEWEDTRQISVIRGVIEIPSLKWEILEENIAYIRLYQFSEKAIFEFKETAIDVLNSPTEKIILDLRNNPGGYLNVAQEVAEYFLEKGEIIVIEDYGEGKQKENLAKGNAWFSEYPIVILINEGSASASEILAGALRDNRQILLIGENSFGKGSVQELKSLKDGSSLKITTAKWLTPQGHCITDVGLKPDIEIKMTPEDYDQERDPQLDKAIEIIKEIR